jgi:hypothetical protein
MNKIVGLASLYEPLEFLENKIRNFNQCDMSDTLIYFSDCSSEGTWAEVEKTIKSECKFDYLVDHHSERKTLYWTWNWIIGKTCGAVYYCNTNVDDILHPQYFEKMSAYLDKHPETEIAVSSWYRTYTKNQIWIPEYDKLIVPDPASTCGHFPMWRASLHDRVGLFNPQMVVIGDTEFWHRVRKKFSMSALAVYPEPLGCYLYHGKNLYHTAKSPDGGTSGEGWDWQFIPKD